jgi:hypothetical protein
MDNSRKKWGIRLLLFWIVFIGIGFFNYSNLINLLIPNIHRSEKINYSTQKVSDAEFEEIALQTPK